MPPGYLEAYRIGTLGERIRRGFRWLRKCTLCPRFCRVDRLAGELGYCRTGRHAVVASYGPHFGEEAPLVGRSGSGTIFFGHCNLFCIFCQNYDISHGGAGTEVSAEQLASLMLDLQRQGCHNINFVTPSHVLCQILEALPLAVEGGLKVPLVYNCGGYERAAGLRLLDGIVDVYMPDFKFWDPEVAEQMCHARDYPERAREALEEMHRQVGDLAVDEQGIAQRGVLVRHLVMPEGLAGSNEIFRFLAERLSTNTYLNIMDQYRPCGQGCGHPRIGRGVTGEEYRAAVAAAGRAGLKRLDQRRLRFAFW